MQYLGDSIAMEGTNAKVTLPDRQHSPATSSPGATFTPSFQTNGPLLENKGYHVVNILQLTVYDDCLLTARVERRSGGSLEPPRTRPSNPLHQLDCC